MQSLPSFFDIESARPLTETGDPLVGLNVQIDWAAFRGDLAPAHIKKRKSRKNHINADAKHKLIQSFAITDAAVHDSPDINSLSHE